MTQSNNTLPTTSRFYEPCLQVLQLNASAPMTVTEIIEAIRLANPEIDFRTCNGGVRAMLMRMASHENSPICMVEGSQPPQFYVEKAIPTAVITAQQPRGRDGQKRCNSIFYAPACEILKANAPAQMSVNEMMKAIIEQYPELEWSHSQGPVRAMLLNAAKLPHSPINQVPNTQPPLFFYKATIRGSAHTEEQPEASAEEIMGNAFAQTQTTLKEKLLEKVLALSPLAFEHLANRLVATMLFGKPEDTPASGDGGIDGYINIYADPLGLNTIGVQAKHYAAGENVQRPEIQQFIGALHGKNGVFVTCSDFSPKAKQEAERSTPSKIVLLNGQLLVEYMIKYKVGVCETGISYTLSEICEEFFEEL